MNVSFCLIVLAGTLLLTSTGCGEKSDLKSLVAQLKAAFPSAIKDNTSANSTSEVNGLVAQAISAIQNNDDVKAVTLLRAARKQPNLTAEQHMALQETIKSMYAELVNRGAHGDPNAKAALAELESKPSQ